MKEKNETMLIPQSPETAELAKPVAWYRELTGYQWWVLIVASLGWMFDTMDQQLFNLARRPENAELVKRLSEQLRTGWKAATPGK